MSDAVPNAEQAYPSEPVQEDGYSNGVNLAQLISENFGLSSLVVGAQLRDDNVEVTFDDEPWNPEDKRQKFMPPYEVVKGKTVVVVGDRLHFKFLFKG